MKTNNRIFEYYPKKDMNNKPKNLIEIKAFVKEIKCNYSLAELRRLYNQPEHFANSCYIVNNKREVIHMPDIFRIFLNSIENINNEILGVEKNYKTLIIDRYTIVYNNLFSSPPLTQSESFDASELCIKYCSCKDTVQRYQILREFLNLICSTTHYNYKRLFCNSQDEYVDIIYPKYFQSECFKGLKAEIFNLEKIYKIYYTKETDKKLFNLETADTENYNVITFHTTEFNNLIKLSKKIEKEVCRNFKENRLKRITYFDNYGNKTELNCCDYKNEWRYVK